MMIPLPQLIKKYNFHPKGVLHLGANLAQEAPIYHACGIKKMIFIEALPDIYKQMVKNLEKYPDAEGINACLSDVDGKEVLFHVANNEGQSSSILSFGSHALDHPTVKFVKDIPMITERLDSMQLDLSGIDYLVTDLQGYDLHAIRGMGDLLNQFTAVYSEVNEGEVYIGCDQLSDMDAYLSDFGFTRVETLMTSAHWGDCLYLKK